jgi:muconolactone delta-isomerase
MKAEREMEVYLQESASLFSPERITGKEAEIARSLRDKGKMERKYYR